MGPKRINASYVEDEEGFHYTGETASESKENSLTKDTFVEPIITTQNTNPDLLPERPGGGKDWNQYVPLKEPK